MKAKITVLLTLLSVGAALIAGPTSKSTPAEWRLKATLAINEQVLAPMVSPRSYRQMFSRTGPAAPMWHENQFTEAKGTPVNHLSFAIRERHRSGPAMHNSPTGETAPGLETSKHPRDGVVVLTGYYDTSSGAVYLLDTRTKKHVKAADHPAVRATKVRAT